jgi:hypothetical protein
MYIKSLSGAFRQNLLENAWMFALPMPETAPIPLFDARNSGI